MSHFSAIKKMGVELEGGWDRIVKSSLPKGAKMVGDGSVTVSAPCVGEINSPAFRTLGELLTFVDKYYPTKVNSSCGLHIHTSFNKKRDYMRIINKEFLEHILAGLKDWGRKAGVKKSGAFWHRLKGDNTYCKPLYMPHMQLPHKNKTGERYTALNYCYARYGTVELRVLPMFKDKILALKAIATYVDLVEGWLRDYALREKVHKAEFELEDISNDEPSIETQELIVCV